MCGGVWRIITDNNTKACDSGGQYFLCFMYNWSLYKLLTTYWASSGPDMLLLLLKALISISAPFSPTRLTSWALSSSHLPHPKVRETPALKNSFRVIYKIVLEPYACNGIKSWQNNKLDLVSPKGLNKKKEAYFWITRFRFTY